MSFEGQKDISRLRLFISQALASIIFQDLPQSLQSETTLETLYLNL